MHSKKRRQQHVAADALTTTQDVVETVAKAKDAQGPVADAMFRASVRAVDVNFKRAEQARALFS